MLGPSNLSRVNAELRWLVGLLVPVLCALFLPFFSPPSVRADTVTPIADIQANPGAFGFVTVEGQIYIPADFSGRYADRGYIQDGSGRGMFFIYYEDAVLLDTGNVVRISGSVEVFFGLIVELVSQSSSEVTLISSGNPPLTPVHLAVAEASTRDWEGTYIEVTAEVQSSAQASWGRNYIVTDETGLMIVRISDALNIPVIPDGTIITAAGAGAKFQNMFMVVVGLASDVRQEPVSASPSTWGRVKTLY